MELQLGSVGRVTAGVAGVAAMAIASMIAPATSAVAGPGTAYVGLHKGTLSITGTSAAEQVTVDFSHATKVKVKVGKKTKTYDRAAVKNVVAFLKGGNDTLTTVSATPAVDLPMQVDAGPGADRVTTGARSDVIVGRGGNDTLLGGAGIDLIDGGPGRDFVNGNAGTDVELLGGGADTAAWVPGEGNDVVVGGAGKDRLQFTGAGAAETFTFAKQGDAAVLQRDLGNVRMDLSGVERVELQALGGADTITVPDLTGSGLTTIAVDLGAGDGAVDQMSFAGTAGDDVVEIDEVDDVLSLVGLPVKLVVTGFEGTDKAKIELGDGNDDINATDPGFAAVLFDLDFGAGE